MILTTTDTFPGRTYEILGVAKGSTVQTVNAIRDIGAGLKTLVGGEVVKYTELMNMGAVAVIFIRYSSVSIMQSAAEVMAYGTAIAFTG